MSHRFFRVGTVACITALSAATLAVVVTPVGHAVTSGLIIRATGQRSSNWSGYGLTGSFSSVTGSWTVPTAAPTTGTTYASTWIGVDGLANRTLIQTGTESDIIGGVAHYDAWWEVLPAAESVIPRIHVAPGDHMTAVIARSSPKKWSITLTDTTTGVTFSVTHGYRGVGASVEWIVERPWVNHGLATLSNYGSTTFSGLTANGVAPQLVPSEAISMVGNVGTNVISTPSAPSALGDSFAVAYGPVAPATPSG